MAMGAADVVPGVSGGTIALIAGIYEKLLDSITALDMKALKLLAAAEFRTLWIKINGSFLLSLLLGILTSIFLLANLITYLINTYPIPVWSFFCGLILISGVLILRDVKRWTLIAVLALPVGVIIAYFITSLTPTSSENSLFNVFLSGAIAICAMILPGISGSFILLIMGKYEYILTALVQRDILILGVFAVGCAVGIMTFSRFISWLLKNYHAITISLLSGFMLGSINKLWPWKRILSYSFSSSGEQTPLVFENILPNNYLEMTKEEPYFLAALFAFFIGILLVIGIERLASYLQNR